MKNDTVALLFYSILSWLLVLMILIERPDPLRLWGALFPAVVAAGFVLALLAVLIVVGRFVKKELQLREVDRILQGEGA